MSEATNRIESLIAEGKKFTFENVGTVDRKYGVIDSLGPDWVAWKTRVRSAIESEFTDNSAPFQLVDGARGIRVIGESREKFDRVFKFYMSSLEAAKAALTEDTFDELLKSTRAVGPKDVTNKVFVVHGRDDAAKAELEVLLGEMGLEPVVLHRQADGGNTVIEKFEKHADVGFAFILLTPDEVAYLASEEAKPDAEREKERRARPNVIFEFGYFVGRLGRGRTCCLYRGDVVLPSDLNGLIYKRFDRSVEEVAYGIQKELKAAGYSLK